MKSIGVIHTPFRRLEDMPIQPKGGAAVTGTVIVAQTYLEGLADLDGFSHIYLIYQFHQARRMQLTVVPFLDSEPRGVFATRSPLRPNHIGLSIVELVAVTGNRLTVRGVDILDGTPLLDIKPYVKAFDEVGECRSGWMRADAATISQKRSDDRFI